MSASELPPVLEPENNKHTHIVNHKYYPHTRARVYPCIHTDHSALYGC